MTHPYSLRKVLLLILAFAAWAAATAIPTPAPVHRLKHQGCKLAPAIGYVTPSYGAKAIAITTQGQPVTTYIPTAYACDTNGVSCTTGYSTSMYRWYSTYVPSYPYGELKFVSRGDDIIALPPRSSPRYAVQTTICTAPGTYRLGEQSYTIVNVPKKIQYVKEIEKHFATCQAHDYLQWLKNQVQSRNGAWLDSSLKQDGGGQRPWWGYNDQTAEDDRVDQETQPYKLPVNYTQCFGDACRTEYQEWSIAYETAVQQQTVVAEFTGWCKKAGSCRIYRYDNNKLVSITIHAGSPGPCTGFRTTTTVATTTRTITSIEAVSTTTRPIIASSITATEALVTRPKVPQSSFGSLSISELGRSLSGSAALASRTSSQQQTTQLSTIVAASQSMLISPSSPSSTASSSSTTVPSALGITTSFRIKIRPNSFHRLFSRQGPIYVSIVDDNMVLVSSPSEAAVFSISEGRLKVSPTIFAFADSADLVSFGPIRVADKSTGPSASFAITPGSNTLVWTNQRFGRKSAGFCVDMDNLINGIYRGENDALLCAEVQLIAEAADNLVSSLSTGLTSASIPTVLFSNSHSLRPRTVSGSSVTEPATSSMLSTRRQGISMVNSALISPRGIIAHPSTFTPLTTSSTALRSSSSSWSQVLSSTRYSTSTNIAILNVHATGSSSSRTRDSSISPTTPTSIGALFSSASSSRSLDLPHSSATPFFILTTSSLAPSTLITFTTRTSSALKSTSSSILPLFSSIPLSETAHTSARAASKVSYTVSSSSGTPQCTPVNTANLVRNGDFETGHLTPWTISTKGAGVEISVSNRNSRSQNYALTINIHNTLASGAISQSMNTCIGREYNGSLLFRFSEDNNTSSCVLTIFINGLRGRTQALTAGKFSKLPFDFRAADKTTQLAIEAKCEAPGTPETVYIDDIVVTDKSPPSKL
ncbi:hypothetical protein ABW19_dt0209515 [Dactylella cylindrospora]|nr:hypothetical protein ABW19_dt0209515 [Dactylella cylindrospora]